MGRSVYAQGQGFSRSELRSKMMEEGDVLLLGAESFWKGFDAKGPSLSQVILTRLPFENPGHPIMEAKTERLEAEGKEFIYGNNYTQSRYPFPSGHGTPDSFSYRCR